MRNNIVALGLGSNLDQPLEYLRTALAHIKKIPHIKVLKLSSIYESDAQLPENANADWNLKYLNAVVVCEVLDDLKPRELLFVLKNIEVKMGRLKSEKWAPRTIDIDLLIWGNLHLNEKDIVLPHSRIFERPFVLLPLIEVLPDVALAERPYWLNSWVSEKPFNTVKSSIYFWPQFVGILNLTTDSFSDGGQLLSAEALLLQSEKLLKAGAEILEVGAESTRPHATLISPEVETKNLNWALDLIRPLKKKFRFKLSLDSRRAEVVTPILESHHLDYLNDVSGFNSKEMQKILKSSNLNAFVMHSLSIPPDDQKVLEQGENPAESLTKWWFKKLKLLKDFGVSEDRLVFDPGIGFGKTKQQNQHLLNHLSDFSQIQAPLMIGHSRKSYQTLFSDRKAGFRDLETALVTQHLNLAYVQFLRVHDVETQKIALRY